MQLTIPPDIEALLEKRLATGAYQNAEDVLRRALEAQDAEEEGWTEEDRLAIAEHLEESFQQAERGELIDGEQARREIAEARRQWLEAHSPR